MRVTSTTMKISNESLKKNFKNMWFPNFNEMRTIVEDYANMALRRKDQWYSFNQLQMQLLISIQIELQTLDMLKERREKGEDPDLIESYEIMTRTTLNALIQIGNGIAFRFLDYNFTLLTLFQANKTSIHAILQEGFPATMELAAILTDHSGPNSQVLIADLNDLINIGDIIVKTDEDFEIIEVKKGRGRGARLRRQRERMESLTNFVNEQIGTIDEQEVEVMKFPSRSHKLKELEECLKEAESEGVSKRKINEFLTVYGIDFEFMSNQNSIDDVTDLFKVINEEIGKSNVLSLSSLEHRQFSGSSIPITAFPIDTKYIVDLLMGSKAYISVLDIDKLEEFMTSKGWIVFNLVKEGVSSEVLEENNLSIFMLFDKDNPQKNFSFPIDNIVSIMMELVDIESYLNCGRVAMAKEEKNNNFIPYFEGEEKIWN
ncbi:hypothetical protein V7134_15845 [Priestia megaterium]|uniref:hypothetical protein n=1 Tax=Priestia megaterium TaxID=1404 RepID=UPI002FFE6A99